MPALTCPASATAAHTLVRHVQASLPNVFCLRAAFSPQPPSNRACPESSLSYDCSIETEGVTIHWSAGGPMPRNDCTGAAADNATFDGMLHMAITANTAGGAAGGDSVRQADGEGERWLILLLLSYYWYESISINSR